MFDKQRYTEFIQRNSQIQSKFQEIISNQKCNCGRIATEINLDKLKAVCFYCSVQQKFEYRSLRSVILLPHQIISLKPKNFDKSYQQIVVIFQQRIEKLKKQFELFLEQFKKQYIPQESTIDKLLEKIIISKERCVKQQKLNQQLQNLIKCVLEVKKLGQSIKQVPADNQKLIKKRLQKCQFKIQPKFQQFQSELLQIINISCQKITFAGGSCQATIPVAYQINKGTLLKQGIHKWKILVQNLVTSYDLGVVSPCHTTHFNTGAKTAWGLRQSSYAHYKQEKGIGYKQNDILSFLLDLQSKELRIEVNGVHSYTHTDVQGPVHVAFSGGQNAKAKIIS